VSGHDGSSLNSLAFSASVPASPGARSARCSAWSSPRRWAGLGQATLTELGFWASLAGTLQPVVHFEVIGKDPAELQTYYSELFGWEIDAEPMPGLVIGMFSDPEGHIIGLVKVGGM
jgi:hypothetical protein